eukprot:365159-Chlamydomonas_euryale.AAC.7
MPPHVGGSGTGGSGTNGSGSRNGGMADVHACGDACAGVAPADDARPERPFLLDTVFDVLHLVTVLAARRDVDAARIGVTGVSVGGVDTCVWVWTLVCGCGHLCVGVVVVA